MTFQLRHLIPDPLFASRCLLYPGALRSIVEARESPTIAPRLSSPGSLLQLPQFTTQNRSYNDRLPESRPPESPPESQNSHTTGTATIPNHRLQRSPILSLPRIISPFVANPANSWRSSIRRGPTTVELDPTLWGLAGIQWELATTRSPLSTQGCRGLEILFHYPYFATPKATHISSGLPTWLLRYTPVHPHSELLQYGPM